MILQPQPHVGVVSQYEVDIGVTGLGNLKVSGKGEVYGGVYGNDVFLEPRGICGTTGQKRCNTEIVRVESKDVYATVLLLDQSDYKWICVIPCKKISSYNNFNILERCKRRMQILKKGGNGFINK